MPRVRVLARDTRGNGASHASRMEIHICRRARGALPAARARENNVRELLSGIATNGSQCTLRCGEVDIYILGQEQMMPGEQTNSQSRAQRCDRFYEVERGPNLNRRTDSTEYVRNACSW